MNLQLDQAPIYRARHLFRDFKRTTGSATTLVHAVKDVSLDIPVGQRLGIVGESGSGKSTLVRMLAALMRPTRGSLAFCGQEITGLQERDLGELRKGVQMVFQDPRSSLDPRMKVSRIITEPLRSPLLRNRTDLPVPSERLVEVMAQVGLDPSHANRYPHEFSGGQRQRIAIARALAPRPQVLIADEAVSALDVSVRAQVLNLVDDLVRQEGLTLLFVSHDLSVVRHVCDTIAVMHDGQIVESGPSEQVYEHPRHAYTKELLAAVPRIRV